MNVRQNWGNKKTNKQNAKVIPVKISTTAQFTHSLMNNNKWLLFKVTEFGDYLVHSIIMATANWYKTYHDFNWAY